jgi:hypothetical protein
MMHLSVLTLVTVLAIAMPALAQQPTAQPEAGSPPTAQSETPGPVEAKIDGFRSAKFGMTEAEVLKAIESDFGLKQSQIRRESNPVQKTSVLVAEVKDLLPGTGTARISYLFGYSNKKLFTVTVLWARSFNPADTREVLIDAAAVLRSHFEGQAFPKGVLVDARLPDGSVLVFRGTDAQGRMVVLTAAGLYVQNAGDKSKETMQPEPVLRLTYIENPQHPDVYSVKQGQF